MTNFKIPTLVCAGLMLPGCVLGTFDEESIGVRSTATPMNGYVTGPNLEVRVYCNDGSAQRLIATTFSKSANSSTQQDMYEYSFGKQVVPAECWRCEGDGCDPASPDDSGITSAKQHTATLSYKMVSGGSEGSLYGFTEDEFYGCVLKSENFKADGSGLDVMKVAQNCELTTQIDVHAERDLAYRMTQAAWGVYMDDPSTGAAKRAQIFGASNLEERFYTRGTESGYALNDNPRWWAKWEAAVLADADYKGPIVLAFAGSDFPNIGFSSAGVTMEYGDPDDFYACSMFDQVPLNRWQLPAGNAASNADAFTVNAPAGVEVHEGYLGYAKAFWNSPQGAQVIDELRSLKSSLRELIVVGHSLGGSQAQLVAAMIEAARKTDSTLPAVSKVITYGAPPVGNQAFVAYYDQLGLGAKTTHYVNPGDPLPRFPKLWHICEDRNLLNSAAKRVACRVFAEEDSDPNRGAYGALTADANAYTGTGVEALLNLDGTVSYSGAFAPYAVGFEMDNHAASMYMTRSSACELNKRCAP